MRTPFLVLLLAGLIALGACSSGDETPSGASSADGGSQLSAAMASSDHYAGAPQRVSFGLILPDNRLVSFGSVDVTFSYVGTAQQPIAPERGPSAVAVYVPTPGTPDRASDDVVGDLAERYADRAVFIHVEIWRDYQNQTINQGAADWLYRNGDLTEPWVFLIGPDGTVMDRWATLLRQDELAAALEALPRMRA